MDKKISFSVDSDVYEKFCLALSLTNETEDAAIENCIRWYIAKAFERASQEYHPTVTEHKTTGNTKTHIQRFELIRPGQFYFDACYNPSKTAFLKNAEKKGCKILNGLGMSSSRGLLRSNYGPDRRLHWM